MVVLTLAAVDLHCRLGPLLCILYRDEHDTIELHMSPIFLVFHTVLRRILVVLLLDGSGRARALVIGHGIVGKDIPIMARLAKARRWSKR